MAQVRDVEVELEQLDAAHGGRSSPLVTGSRPQFFYAGLDWDCQIEVISAGPVSPQIGIRAYLGFISPAEHFGHLAVGAPFLIREGQRTIAFGKVLRLVDLEAHARAAMAQPGYSADPRRAAT